jgi:TIR domain
MTASEDSIYDLAFSFAGEHRSYVEQTVHACKQLGLRVFYDKDMSNEWWGKNFIREQRKVYGARTRFFVPFISTEYLAKPIPMDEFSAAMMTAVKQGDGYVLPVLIGDVQVPADLLHPHIQYLRVEDYTPEQLSHQFKARVKGAAVSGYEARGIGDVVEEALGLRLPKAVPSDYTHPQALRAVLQYLGDQFETAAPLLKPRGFTCAVHRYPDRLVISVKWHQDMIYTLDIQYASGLGHHFLHFEVADRPTSTGHNAGSAMAYYDAQAARPKLRLFNRSLGAIRKSELTAEELFSALWNVIIDHLNRV